MRVLIAIATWFARAYYFVLKRLFPSRRKVVMLSRQADVPSRDFTMLAEELRRLDPDLEVVVRCRFIGPSLGERVAYLSEVLTQMYHLATSRACVLDGYIVPVSLLSHHRDLFVVQMWHALGAIKRFGYQSLDRPSGRSSAIARDMRMHRNYDVVLCGGPATIPVFAEAFGVDPARVRPLGLPRVDDLVAHAGDATADPEPSVARRLRERHPLLADRSRRVILYAPTFRRGRPDRFSEVIAAFDADRFTLVVKPHPLVGADVSGPNVVNASDIDVLDLLPFADAVITDYSAVAFEACVLDIPLYFYVFDLDEYLDEYGLNLDPATELPQVTSRDIGRIAELIAGEPYDRALLHRLRERYVPVTDGGCTRRIAELVLDHTNEVPAR